VGACFEREAAGVLVAVGAVLRGEFRLSSGRVSGVYVDVRRVLGVGWASRALAGLLVACASRVARGADAVVGVATGGVPWASWLALLMGVPLGYVRRSAKGHGTGSRVEGWRGPGSALLVDDVATTGGSLAGAVEALRSAGVKVEDAVVVVDRGEGARERLASLGVRLHALTTLAAVEAAAGGEPA